MSTTDRTTPANQPYHRTATRHDGAAEPAGPTIWEPWCPVVGQRVRIRSNTECPTRDPEGVMIDGATATIDLVLPADTPWINAGHRFGFQLEDGRYGIAAACELVPVDGDEDDG